MIYIPWIQYLFYHPQNFLTSIWILQIFGQFLSPIITRAFKHQQRVKESLFESPKNSIGFGAYSTWNSRIPSIPTADGGVAACSSASEAVRGCKEERVAEEEGYEEEGGDEGRRMERERERTIEVCAAETQSHLCGVCVAVSLFFSGRSSWLPTSRTSSGTIDTDITHALRIRVRLLSKLRRNAFSVQRLFARTLPQTCVIGRLRFTVFRVSQ